MDESAAFIATAGKRTSQRMRLLLEHPREVLTVIGLTMGGTLSFYTFTTYAQKFLVTTTGFTKEDATSIAALSLLVFTVLQPVMGWLSDLVGRRAMLLTFGICGTVFTVPLMTALGSATTYSEAFVLVMAALVIVSTYTAVSAVVKAELFPTEIRALGVGLPYAIAVAIFGGTAEYVALWTKNAGHERWFYWYVTACTAVSLTVYFLMRDTKRYSRIAADA